MSAAAVFEIVNTMVLPAWLILLFGQKWKWRDPFIYSFAALMAIVYSYYVITGLGDFDPSAFNSLIGVKNLFTSDEALLAGWVHYLIFDLLIGNWIVNQSVKLGVKHLLIVPCLLLSFMFGPIGYLLFTIIKLIKTRAIA